MPTTTLSGITWFATATVRIADPYDPYRAPMTALWPICQGCGQSATGRYPGYFACHRCGTRV